ncbi:MAG: ribosome-recycling factor [Candidatus Parcubacteria bacterium]|nr:ribosome recycling factor [Patescibacteria group bacterium]BCX16027.1 MAG: ribosome-recycling factor [Candidatus Parcubacteria bacterium]
METEIEKKFKDSLAQIEKAFREEIASVRGSRPTPALVEDVLVDYYGQKVPLKQLASISVIPPREIQISAWDKMAVSGIIKAVSSALNLQAVSDGSVIHINFPSLTQERRQELIRLVKEKTEEFKVRSRLLRDEVKKEISEKEKNKEITEDDKFQLNERIQKILDEFNERVEDYLKKKIDEINE